MCTHFEKLIEIVGILEPEEEHLFAGIDGDTPFLFRVGQVLSYTDDILEELVGKCPLDE